FPNNQALLSIMAVLPVSASTVERSFSTQKRIKNYLRNSSNEERLTSLALLSIHRDISIQVDNDMILDHLNQKAR
ncbi:hypothetical protein HELRODRAFT_153338, partial [Helobdella robusta]|uniref:HAT C-terminal dimerisation domain-containing protein n=1 Tax=Helobdella robusta TaxID=6412 RepID=T1EL42_HELRO